MTGKKRESRLKADDFTEWNNPSRAIDKETIYGKMFESTLVGAEPFGGYSGQVLAWLKLLGETESKCKDYAKNRMGRTRHSIQGRRYLP